MHSLASWVPLLAIVVLMLTQKRSSMTMQWVVALAASALMIAAAVYNHDGRWWLIAYFAVVAIGFPVVAIRQYRKSRRPLTD